MAVAKKIKKFLYNNLSFEGYLRTLSRFYFFSYHTGLLKNNSAIQYPYFLKSIIKKGDIIIDIGANLGYYTCLMARWVGHTGRIYAVEPVEPVRNVLKKNARKFGWVEILPYALGSENKKIYLGNDSLKRQDYVASGSHFVMDSVETTDMPEITFNAEMRKGSELFAGLKRLDFVKCDVEGYESFIIPEMKEIFDKHKPMLLIETGEDDRIAIISLMQTMDYRPFVLKNQKLCPLQPSDKEDIMFIHKENKSITI